MQCEHTTRAATRLYQSAVRESITWSQSKKDGLTTDYLFTLAITNRLELTPRDKARLSPLHIAQLAVTEKIELDQEDKDRMPTDLLFNLLAEGFVALTEVEFARFSPEQLDSLQHLEPILTESLPFEMAGVDENLAPC